jgi:mitochondrial fission protein ELM1
MKTSLIQRQKVLDAIDKEPEYPGKIHPKIKSILNQAIEEKDIDLLVEIMRRTVKLTKSGIRKRISEIES